jgi:ATP-dependent Clp protease adapter protein ClpS
MLTLVSNAPKKSRDTGVIHDTGWQVILYNDNVNMFRHVVKCLMKVFGHPESLAHKIAMEAHLNGKTVAEVEGHDAAVLHKQQLQSCGLGVAIERI